LGQELDQLRVKLGRERASGKIDLALNHIHFDLHETVGDDFLRAFKAKTVEMTTSSWEEYFAALERYKDGEGNGDPNCLLSYMTKDTPPLKLGNWLSGQRVAKKGKGNYTLSSNQINRLQDLGVWWDKAEIWDVYFAALERYKADEGKGDPNCPKGYIITYEGSQLNLGEWLKTQRRAEKGTATANKISTEQIRRLKELGVRWRTPGGREREKTDWERAFLALERYKAGEGSGDPNCPAKYVTKDTPPLKLGSWLHTQRQAKKGDRRYTRISDEHIRRLEELGVWWMYPYGFTWEQYYSALEQYKAGEGNGDPNCSLKYVTKDTPPLKLGKWLSRQREANKGIGNSKISDEQTRRFEELGVRWNKP
jgi:hypothetical protein